MPLTIDPDASPAEQHRRNIWRFVFLVSFAATIFFSFLAVANLDRLAKDSAAFQAWMRGQTDYMVERDKVWNERFERIDTKLAEWDALYRRINKVLDELDARNGK